MLEDVIYRSWRCLKRYDYLIVTGWLPHSRLIQHEEYGHTNGTNPLRTDNITNLRLSATKPCVNLMGHIAQTILVLGFINNWNVIMSVKIWSARNDVRKSLLAILFWTFLYGKPCTHSKRFVFPCVIITRIAQRICMGVVWNTAICHRRSLCCAYTDHASYKSRNENWISTGITGLLIIDKRYRWELVHYSVVRVTYVAPLTDMV